MEMTIKVMLDLTPAMQDCINAVCAALARKAIADETRPPMEAPAPAPMPAPAPAPTEPTPAEPEQAPAPEPAPAAPVPVYDDAYLRAAMDRCRTRLIGADWETDKTTERYKKYFSKLNEHFRIIARSLAASFNIQASKPTELPQTEVRVAFANSLDELIIDENGEIGAPMPF